MHIDPAKRPIGPRWTRRRTAAARTAARLETAWRAAAGRLSRDEGFLLIEVIISAMLVALIVVATLNGFDVANRTSADQRRHDQAAVLAAQSQEQLRSDPGNALEALESTPHSYTRTLNGTTYTITESAKYINDATQGATCAAAGGGASSTQSTSYLQITSVVSWAALNTNRPAVEQSSIVTPPTGSALEVDVVNGGSPEEGVSGVSALTEYTGVESVLPTTVEGTTGLDGCLVFGAIPATSATLTVKAPTGYVTPSASATIPTEQVTLAPNITTHKEFTLNRGGAIKGEFTYAGKPVEGETFVAFHTKLTSPAFILASTAYSYEASGEERYTTLAGSPATTATTPMHTAYPTGNLFPWPSAYEVYAGDCPADSVTATTNPENLKNREVLVSPGATATVTIPLSYVQLNVYTGKKTAPGSLTTQSLPVQIADAACKEATPDAATGPLYIHEQQLSGGHLLHPYQPYGVFTLCVYSATKKSNYTVTYANETQAGSTRNVYLEEGSSTEQEVAPNPSTPC